MLTADEIRVLIVLRIQAAMDSCNSSHINNCKGQIRALVSVLNDVKPCPSSNLATDMLRAAGIPFTETDDQFDIDGDWLIEHGCKLEGENGGNVSHAKFSGW